MILAIAVAVCRVSLKQVAQPCGHSPCLVCLWLGVGEPPEYKGTVLCPGSSTPNGVLRDPAWQRLECLFAERVWRFSEAILRQ